MKILCLEPTLKECSDALHPKHLRQCYLEVLATLSFLGGLSSPYHKNNANTKSWIGYEGSLYLYSEHLKRRLDALWIFVPDLRYLRVASDVAKHYNGVLKVSGLPKWFGSPDALDGHRGWVMKTSRNHKGLYEHYAPMYGSVKPVARIKQPKGTKVA